MTRSWKFWKRTNKQAPRHPVSQPASTVADLREFAYLDEVSVQSLLASLIGTLPSEVTSLSAQSNEAEIGSSIGASAPMLANAEVTARFKGSSSASKQVLSRAVAESLFKKLYEEAGARKFWAPASTETDQPLPLKRGDLLEIDVEFSPDPIYAFSATMGVLSDIAEDYPPLLESKETALVLSESGPVNKVLDRLLVGLVPTKSLALQLRAGEEGGKLVAASEHYFDSKGIAHSPLHIVGVTEQEKYWRDVRRVLFSRNNFKILGRVGRSGVQRSWTPVKLTEVMREIAPEFPDAITRVGKVGYATPVNSRAEKNRDALEKALLHFALAAGGAQAEAHRVEILAFVKSKRTLADSLIEQGRAFDQLTSWMIQSQILPDHPENERNLRSEARAAAELKMSSEAVSLTDFETAGNEDANLATEALIDLEIIAIYW